MNFYNLSIIAIALSLDAFGVALCVGLEEGLKLKNKILFSLSFGVFQFLFCILGAYAGVLFNLYVATVPKVIGGALIALVGIVMIKEGFENKDENIFLNWKMYFILGISVSIDALVIGFTVFSSISSHALILGYTLYVGLVTLIISGVAFLLAKYLRKIDVVSKYADYIGGVILILFGIKMMFL